MEFARQLQATVDPAIKDRDQRMYEAKEKALADGVVSRNAWEKAPLTASSDSGGVSQMMPMNLFTAVCWPLGVAPHTWQSCASAGSTIGQKGQIVARCGDEPVYARLHGIVRGMLQEGVPVKKGLKIGDVDARIEEKLCYTISDKARKIGNGVAEAIDLVYKTK